MFYTIYFDYILSFSFPVLPASLATNFMLFPLISFKNGKIKQNKNPTIKIPTKSKQTKTKTPNQIRQKYQNEQNKTNQTNKHKVLME